MDGRTIAFAERLASEFENERANAKTAVEKATGRPLDVMIKNGGDALLTPLQNSKIQHCLQTMTEDDLILGVGAILKANKIRWPDLLAGDTVTQTQYKTSAERAFEEIEREMEHGKERPVGIKRISRQNLPDSAYVKPILQKSGKNQSGKRIATFYLAGEQDGAEVRYMGSFIAAGDIWTEKMVAAAKAHHPIGVIFVIPEDLNRMVEVRELA